MLTFLFGEGDIQKGNLNLIFLKNGGNELIAKDAVNLEQFVPHKQKDHILPSLYFEVF